MVHLAVAVGNGGEIEARLGEAEGGGVEGAAGCGACGVKDVCGALAGCFCELSA